MMDPRPSRPLRILHSEAAVTFGGQEHRIYKEMLAMRERGHYLEAVCQPGAMLVERLRQQGFRVHEVAMPGLGGFARGAVAVARILGEGRFDVLNTHSRIDTILASVAARVRRTPLIVRTRHLAKPPRSLLSYTVLPHRVVAVSEHVRQLMLDRGIGADKVATVMTAINIPEPVRDSTLRRELGLGSDAVVIVSVGHMRFEKGHPQLIAAALPLLRAKPNLHLVIAGRGDFLLNELRRQVADMGMTGQVHLLGMRQDVVNVLCGSDIFALATQIEALGTSFIEAAACGLPLVGTNVGGVPEIVKHEVNGLLVDLHRPDQLTQALRRLVDDPALRARMGRTAREQIMADRRFTVAHMAEAMEAAYHRWLPEQRGQPAA